MRICPRIKSYGFYGEKTNIVPTAFQSWGMNTQTNNIAFPRLPVVGNEYSNQQSINRLFTNKCDSDNFFNYWF